MSLLDCENNTTLYVQQIPFFKFSPSLFLLVLISNLISVTIQTTIPYHNTDDEFMKALSNVAMSSIILAYTLVTVNKLVITTKIQYPIKNGGKYYTFPIG